MTHPNKIKGNNFERELVELAKEWGLHAERSWCSDGRSQGLPKDVDVTIEGYRVQCKRKARLPQWTKMDNCDMVVVREDRGEATVIMPLSRFLVLLNGFNSLSKEKEAWVSSWVSSQKT